MKKIFYMVCGIVLCACGEGENVQWIDIGSSCEKEWKEVESSSESDKSTIGGTICGAHGKSYGAEWRCKEDRIQVKCE